MKLNEIKARPEWDRVQQVDALRIQEKGGLEVSNPTVILIVDAMGGVVKVMARLSGQKVKRYHKMGFMTIGVKRWSFLLNG